MVIQLPVFIALYNVLGYAIELRHASFIPTVPFTDIVWLADLSTKDPLLITPIVMGATMFLQQKMTPSPGDPTQAKMMMFLPLDLHLYVSELRLRPGDLLAGEQRAFHHPTTLYQQVPYVGFRGSIDGVSGV